MTPAQRRLRTNWLIAAAVLLLVLVFGDFVEANAAWLRWVLFAGIVFASFGQGRSRSQMARDGNEDLASLVESAPWLKIWFSVWAAVALIGAIYVTRRDVDLFQLVGGIRFFILSFAILVGPALALNERRRFRELGEDRDAL
ncbi:hypothetical protein ACFPOE_13680 [Caenimonas terrae]|uniref:DUF2178 domain-containing protein n=1 Tax=Caenimonas terrae TaxID=696074 RepID=A0ABW0NH04_9BURK